MIEAGFQVLCASGIADEYLEDVDRLLVADIYLAMVSVTPGLPSGIKQRQKVP
jgi:hypothetical protein